VILESLFSAIAEDGFGYLLQQSGLAEQPGNSKLRRVVVYAAEPAPVEIGETKRLESLSRRK